MDITSDTRVEDILTQQPALTKVFVEFGLPCLVCGEAYWGTIADLARGHDIDMDALLMALNDKKEKGHEEI